MATENVGKSIGNAERIVMLEADLELLKKSNYSILTKVRKEMFLTGFCYAKFHTDIAYAMAFNYDRCSEIEKTLEQLIVNLKHK